LPYGDSPSPLCSEVGGMNSPLLFQILRSFTSCEEHFFFKDMVFPPLFRLSFLPPLLSHPRLFLRNPLLLFTFKTRCEECLVPPLDTQLVAPTFFFGVVDAPSLRFSLLPPTPKVSPLKVTKFRNLYFPNSHSVSMWESFC